jgi:hypothetical protein
MGRMTWIAREFQDDHGSKSGEHRQRSSGLCKYLAQESLTLAQWHEREREAPWRFAIQMADRVTNQT